MKLEIQAKLVYLILSHIVFYDDFYDDLCIDSWSAKNPEFFDVRTTYP